MSNKAISPDRKFILIGKIAKVHGLKGELKVYAYSGQPENLNDYRKVLLTTGDGRLSLPMAVESCRTQGKFAIIKFASVHSREQAETMVGMGVLLDRLNLPPLGKDYYYWQDYIGLDVFTVSGTYLGKVDNLFSNGGQDVLIISGSNGELLVPVTREIVAREDEDKLIINPPPGLLDINC